MARKTDFLRNEILNEVRYRNGNQPLFYSMTVEWNNAQICQLFLSRLSSKTPSFLYVLKIKADCEVLI